VSRGKGKRHLLHESLRLEPEILWHWSADRIAVPDEDERRANILKGQTKLAALLMRVGIRGQIRGEKGTPAAFGSGM
jgi:hypothetical protein